MQYARDLDLAVASHHVVSLRTRSRPLSRMRSCSNSKISNNCFLLRIPVLEDFFPDRVLVVSATKAALVRVRRCGPWKLHIHHAERAPIYGLWTMRELEEHGHPLSPGTLYPLLSRVEGKGG